MAVELDRESPAGRNLQALRWLASRLSRGELPPSAREVAAACGLKSSRSGHGILGELEKEGLIERSEAPKNQRRPLRITERGWQVVGEGSVMGSIAAGRGLEAVPHEQAYSIAGELLGPRGARQRYLLRVVGESMVEARIHDGDLLVVEEDPDPPDGSVVVALLAGDEVTVKRLYRYNGSVKLRAESADYEDIVVPFGEVQIQGRVVASIHSF